MGFAEIINGDARGADRLSSVWAESNNIPIRKFPADWDLHGKRAGPIRNSQMLREGTPDLVIAFLFPNSRGTRHMIDIAQKAGIITDVHNLGVWNPVDSPSEPLG